MSADWTINRVKRLLCQFDIGLVFHCAGSYKEPYTEYKDSDFIDMHQAHIIYYLGKQIVWNYCYQTFRKFVSDSELGFGPKFILYDYDIPITT